MTLKLKKFFTFLVILVSACGDQKERSQLKSSIPASRDEMALLGMGFSSNDAKVTGSSCFKNLPMETLPARESHVEFFRNLDFAALSRLINASVEIGVPVFPGITVQGRIKFAEEFAASDYSETLVLHFRAVGARTRVFFSDSSSNVWPTASLERLQASSDKDGVRAMCGDQYVASIEKGMDSVAVLKIEFANSAEKQAFGGGFGAEILGGIVSVNLDLAYENIKQRSNSKVTLSVIQQGGDVTRLLSVLPTDPRSAAGFLQCSYETREHCYEVMRSVLREFDAMGSLAQSDNGLEPGNLAPMNIETSPYPEFNRMREARASEEDAKVLTRRRWTLEDARRRLMLVYGDASSDQKRAGELLRGLGLDLPPSTRENLKQIEQNAEIVRTLAQEKLAICWDSVKIRTDDGVTACSNEAKLLESRYRSGDLYYDRKPLNPDPLNFRSWCYLAFYPGFFSTDEIQIPEIIDDDERKTIQALLKEIELIPTKDSLGKVCIDAETKLNARSELSLEGVGIASTRPLATLRNLIALNLKNNFVQNISPLLHLTKLGALDLTHNYVRTLDDFLGFAPKTPARLVVRENLIHDASALSNPDFPWRNVDLSRNLVTQVNMPIAPSSLRQLDVSGNPLQNIAGLSSISGLVEFELTACNDRVTACPFVETDQRFCRLRTTDSRLCRRGDLR